MFNSLTLGMLILIPFSFGNPNSFNQLHTTNKASSSAVSVIKFPIAVHDYNIGVLFKFIFSNLSTYIVPFVHAVGQTLRFNTDLSTSKCLCFLPCATADININRGVNQHSSLQAFCLCPATVCLRSPPTIIWLLWLTLHEGYF